MSLTDFTEAIAKTRSKEVEIEVFKVVLLGPPEAGKTQLASALVGEYEEVTESTPISTGAKVVVQRYVENDLIWQSLTKDIFQQSLHSTAREFMQDWQSQFESSQPDFPQFELPLLKLSQSGNDKGNKRNQASMKYVVPTQEHHSVTKTSPENHDSSTHMQAESESPPSESLERKRTFHKLLMGVAECCKAYDADKTLKVRYMHLIDNGGQPAFFDAHPVFATSRATYLLVYDMHMQDGLRGKPPYTYRKKGHEPITNKNCTNLDIIKACLMTVISLKEKFQAAEKYLTLSNKGAAEESPVVLVVGTRYDLMHDEGVIQQDQELHEECKLLFPAWDDAQMCRLFGTDKEMRLFPVNCLNKNCKGVKEVQKKAIPFEHGLKMKIPIKWFHCHLLFWHAKEDITESGDKRYPGLEVLLFSTLYNLCLRENLISDEEELLDMVRTFHILGLFFFPALNQEQEKGWAPNDHPVFTDPDLLYSELTKILEVTFKKELRDGNPDPSDGKHFRWLKEGGELTLEVMRRLGVPDSMGELTPNILQRHGFVNFRLYLLEQLSRWGLGAKIPNEDAMNDGDGPTLFIPCVLTPCNEAVGQQEVDLTMQSLTVFLTISESVPAKWYFLPNGVFTHFVVNLLCSPKKYKRQKRPGEVYCYRDSIPLVRQMDAKVKYKYLLTVAICNKSIAACISRAQKEMVVDPHDLQVIIWEELTVALEKACKDMYHKELTATVATNCPCTDYSPHLAELCADTKNLSCLLNETVNGLPPEEKLLLYILEAQHAGMCCVYIVCILIEVTSSYFY